MRRLFDRIGRWADFATAAGWVVIALATCAMAIVVMYVGAVPAPFWDEWGYTDPSVYLLHMMQRHNEHPFMFGRIAMALDYWIADGRGWFLQAMIYLALALQVGAYVCLGALSGHRQRRTLIVLAAFCSVLVFSPHTSETLVMGLTLHFVAAYTATAAAVASLAFFAGRRRAWLLGLSIACAVVAATSLANGLLTPVLLAAMAFYLRLPRGILLAFVGLSILTWSLYFNMTGSSPPMSAPALADIPNLLIYMLRYLGGQIANVLGYWYRHGRPLINAPEFAIGVGGVLLVSALGLLAKVLATPTRAPAAVAAAALVVFALSTAGLTALGRAGSFAPEQALSPRYAATGAMLLIAIVILVMATIKVQSRWLLRGALGGGLVAALTVPGLAIFLIGDLGRQQRDRLSGQTALIVGVRDAQSIGMLAYDVDGAIASAIGLRAAGKWLFQDKWSRALGRDLSPDLAAGDGDCRGTIEASAFDGYWRFRGSVERARTRQAKIVLLVEGGGRLVGYGVAPRRASDLSPLGFDPQQRVDWQGHARADSRLPLAAYLATPERVVCEIGLQSTN